MADSRWTDVLGFWFGASDSPEFGRSRPCWFEKSADFDARLRERFVTLHEEAAAGTLETWLARPLSALALVTVLDQFSRNMFRDTARAFGTDSLALAAARKTVERGFDTVLLPVQRWFVYLPFEHAEDLGAQQEGIALFERLRGDAASASPIEYAIRHHAIIERFGRFPHRNTILGRPSTPEELAFLAGPGSSF
jgi:uncharacterized protein (DUF924 family)